MIKTTLMCLVLNEFSVFLAGALIWSASVSDILEQVRRHRNILIRS